MNPISLNSYYQLNKGLEFADNDEGPALAGALPQKTAVAPVELPGAGNIDRLLENRGTEALQYEWIQPQVADPAVLTPAGFSAALAGAIRTLGDAAQRAPVSEQAAALSRTVRELKSAEGLREQVRAMMHALLAG